MKDSKSDEPSDSEWNWEESMRLAIHLNISIAEYEELTPYELNLIAEVFEERQAAEQELKVTLVWLGEYYHRIKKLPSLKDVLKKTTQSQAMTDEQMLLTVKQLNQKLGGSTK